MLSRRLPSLGLGAAALAATTALTLASTGSHEIGGAVRGPGGSPTAVAVGALTSAGPDEALAAVPEGFAGDRGYRPVVQDGHLVRPDGGCSSPVPLPAEFETACREHDYGYDLLRHAETTGAPLGRWARGALDDRFADRVRAVCRELAAPSPSTAPAASDSTTPTVSDSSTPGHTRSDRCRVSAEIAITGVELNSVRQGDGVPEESPLTRAALGTSALGLFGLGAALPRRRW